MSEDTKNVLTEVAVALMQGFAANFAALSVLFLIIWVWRQL